VQGLKRGARIILTGWVLLMVPLIGLELALTIFNGPTLVRLFAESLNYQVRELVGQLGRADIAGGLLSVFSVIMLVLPMAGLCYVLLLTGWRFLRALVAVNRRRPVLWLPSAAMVLLVAAVLAVHWHLLPPVGGAAPSPSAAGDVTVQRPPAATPAPVVGAAAASASSQSRATTPARPAAPARPETPARRARPPVLITPVGAHGFDPLDPQGDPNDENDGEARYAIDGDPATAWQSQYYLGSPVFGGLKAGSGLILDMGRPVRVRSVTVTFGAEPGADVAIKVGNDDALAASSLPSFTTVAAAGGIGGTHTFRITRPPRRRYLLIWFTKLPPIGPGRYRAQISSVVVRGFR
jgi:hypothetical protein